MGLQTRKTRRSRKKLDKTLATLDWIDLYPNFKLSNAIASKLDHSPTFLQLHDDSRKRFCKKFKFQNSWLLELELNAIVKNGLANFVDYDFYLK